MFVLRPTSSSAVYSQPAWQQPTYEPFSAFLLPPHSARPQQPSRPTRRSPWYRPSAADSYLPSASYYLNGGMYRDGHYDEDVDDADDSELMEELLLARLQEQRRQEAAEAERLYRARVLRERQLQQMEQQLLAEQQRRAAVRRQQEQARRQQAQRQADEQQRQRREQEQAEQYAHRLQSALAQLLLGRQLEGEPEQVDSRKQAGAKLTVRSEEQAEQKKQIKAAAQPASPAPVASTSLAGMPASTPSSQTNSTSTTAFSRPSIRIRTIPISSSTPSTSAPSPLASVSSTTNTAAATADHSARDILNRNRRSSVEIEDVPSSPDRLKADADEDVWAVEKRLHTPKPTTTGTTAATPAA